MRYHFPRNWEMNSKILADNGYNLVEMNEYDKQTQMPRIGHKFDKNLY